ncbi:MAG: integrase core domain-containing protein [Pseudomonadota bacterium]
MLQLLLVLLRTLLSSFRPRTELVLENLALRQQLATFKAQGKKPRIRFADRAFWILLHRLWARSVDVLLFVKPETVVGWHKAAFHLFWRCLSRRRNRTGRKPTARELRDLIRKLAAENNWGAPRIHGELLKLGFSISEKTVSRYLPKRRATPGTIERWKAFLRNHAEGIAAMDFVVVPTATFRLLYVLFVIHHASRRIIHLNVTEHPTSAWICQQLREAFPYDTAPRHLIFDRDASFSASVVATIKSMGIKPTRTAYHCPWQNGLAERWVGSVRRELLDHVVVFGERHLLRLLRQYETYYHEDRTHLGLGKETPGKRPTETRPSSTAKVIALPRIGGLHHRYTWREAA